MTPNTAESATPQPTIAPGVANICAVMPNHAADATAVARMKSRHEDRHGQYQDLRRSGRQRHADIATCGRQAIQRQKQGRANQPSAGASPEDEADRETLVLERLTNRGLMAIKERESLRDPQPEGAETKRPEG